MAEISLQIPFLRRPRDAPVQFQARRIQGKSSTLQTLPLFCTVRTSIHFFFFFTSITNLKCYFVIISKYLIYQTNPPTKFASSAVASIWRIWFCPGYVQRAHDGDPQTQLQPHDHESDLLQETSVHPPGIHAVAVGCGWEAISGFVCWCGDRQCGPLPPVRSFLLCCDTQRCFTLMSGSW